MKRSLLFVAFFAAALFVRACGATPAWAFSSGGPSSNTVEGTTVCAGPPTLGGLLQYNGTTFCDANLPTNVAGITFGTGAYPDLVFGSGKELYISETSTHYIGFSASLIQLNNPLSWGTIAAPDLSEAKAPRAPLGFGSVVTTGTYALGALLQYTPTVAMHVRSWDLKINPAPAACTTFPVYQITINGSNQAASAITLANTTSGYHVGSLALAIAADQILAVTETTAGVACAVTPAFTFVLELTTD